MTARRLVSLACACLCTLAARPSWADNHPFLSPLFADNRGVQRSIPAPVWGWATPGTKGTVVLAGQAWDTAFEYGSDQLAWRARREGRVNDDAVVYLPWIERLQKFDPKRVVFAHDRAVWEP